MDNKHVWIGHPLELLLANDPNNVKPHFQDYGRDISILSNTSVATAFFFLNDQVEELFNIASKICKNLGKSLIVMTEKDAHLDKYRGLESCHFIKISSDKPFGTQFELIIEKVRQSFSTEGRGASNRLNKIDHYIDKHINRDIREEEVANLANFSTTYFSKFFRKHKKISFQEYLSTKRVELSKQLLVTQPREKVSSIAFQVGYSDVSYFNRVFKKHTSLTPTEYRQTSTR